MATRIACYLTVTAKMRIEMASALDDNAMPQIEGFSDDDYAADKADRKLMTGGVLRLKRMIVSWSARNQGCVSLPAMEAEFVTAGEVPR